MAPSIELRKLGKQYVDRRRVPSTLREAMTRRWRSSPRRSELPWALRDVTLDVDDGACLGVIGRNGSGKTTLLKLLAGITEPTEGKARVREPIGALLEVGTGFHPELTGRENIYFNGAVLGMTRRSIDQSFDEIVDFADVGEALDLPLKHFSTGMALRLAFAVAAMLPSRVLLVDEVLAVGDLEFQRRCLDRLEETARGRRTVVFVSHDLNAVNRLCTDTLWLDRGHVAAHGPTTTVVSEYLAATADSSMVSELGIVSGAVQLSSAAVVDERGHPVAAVLRGRPFRIEVRFTLLEPVSGFDLAIYLERDGRIRVFDELMSESSAERPRTPGRYVAAIDVPGVFNVGEYHIGVWAGTSVGASFDEILDAPAITRFRIEGDAAARPARFVELDLPWTIRADPASG
jgi:ABC-2 type transport system ATP-binding protein/lipopolysaccharide transport system ATP-binding protein